MMVLMSKSKERIAPATCTFLVAPQDVGACPSCEGSAFGADRADSVAGGDDRQVRVAAEGRRQSVQGRRQGEGGARGERLMEEKCVYLDYWH